MFRRVGNQCLVFYTNGPAAEVCEADTDNIRGIIVADYDTVIQPGANIVASVLNRSFVDSYSTVKSSVLNFAKVRRSVIDHSRISTTMTHVSDSTVIGSVVASSDLAHASIVNSYLYSAMYRGNAHSKSVYFEKETPVNEEYDWSPYVSRFPSCD